MFHKLINRTKTITMLFLVVVISFSNCITFASDEKNMTDDAITEATYLIDDVWTHPGSGERPYPSGWDIDIRGGQFTSKGYNATIVDANNEYPFVMTKKFNAISSGTATFEAPVKFSNYCNGIAFVFSDNGSEIIRMETRNGFIYFYHSNGKCKTVYNYKPGVLFGIKLELDLDNNRIKIFIDGQTKANFEFDRGDMSFNQLTIKTPAEGYVNVDVNYIKLYVNYLVNECFSSVGLGMLPDDWKYNDSENGAIAVQQIKGTKPNENYSLMIKDSNVTQKNEVKKYFSDTEGKVCFQFMTLMPEKINGVEFELRDNDKSVIKLHTKDGAFYCGNQLIYKYTDNIWYTIRFEVDVDSKVADIKINGKLMAQGIELASNCTKVNNIRFSTLYSLRGFMWIDDIKVYKMLPEPEDYVSKPVIPQKDGESYIGMIVCSLWREGYHLGWDSINAYKSERKPYLGYYDEGNPEVADWEIKWMAENGVDYQSFCWYLPSGWAEGAIKNPNQAEAIHDGYFNAKYSDYLKFAIMWENDYGAVTPEQFRSIIVPYWIEYYLKDPRYMVINNKPVIQIYSWKKLIENFGGAEKTKAELDYLRDVCKDLGFDDAIITASISNADKTSHQSIKDAGFDGTYVYTWGDDSGIGDYTIQYNKLLMQKNLGITNQIATATMGWDDEAWRGWERECGYIDPKEFEKLLQVIKTDFLPQQAQESPTKNMVMLGCWNEFGEGHFLMPSAIHGFEYMDAIRRTFTKSDNLENALPTENAIKRMGRLYVNDFNFKRFQEHNAETKETILENGKVLKGWNFKDNESLDDWKIVKDIENLRIENGVLKGTSVGNDPGIVLKTGKQVNIPSQNANYLVVRMKLNSVDKGPALFFLTDKDSTWDQNKSIKATVTSDDMETYVISLSNNKFWTDNIIDLRFDPMKSVGDFEIESIELVQYTSEIITDVSFDGEMLELKRLLQIKQGTTYMPLLELLELTGAYVHVDNSTAYMERDNTKIAMKLDSKTVLVNEKTVETEYPMIEENDVYYVPLRFVYELLGFKVEYNGSARTIELISPKKPRTHVNQVQESKEYHWEFNNEGDFEGWKLNSQSTGVVQNGMVNADSTGTDPSMALSNLSIDTKYYSTIVVGIQNYSDSKLAVMHAITSPNNKLIAATMPITTFNTDVCEYKFDMTNYPDWNGILTWLQFDFINTVGKCSIDYIRLEN